MDATQIHEPSSGRRMMTAIAIVLALLTGFGGYHLLRNTILSNARGFGDQLARSFAAEEEVRLEAMSLMVVNGANDLDTLMSFGATEADFQRRLDVLGSSTSRVLDGVSTSPFLIVDGSIITSSSETAADHADVDREAWYRELREQNDPVMISDAYQGRESGAELLTIATLVDGKADVLGIDVPAGQFEALNSRFELPANSSYFLFDGAGEIVAAETSVDVGDGLSDEYMDRLGESVLAGRLDDESTTYVGTVGEERSIFYAELENGWLSVITIPTSEVLSSGWDESLTVLAGICLVLTIVMVGVLVAYRVRSARLRKVTHTLQILGNTFYAIYLIDYKRGTYTSIKSRPEIAAQLGKRGSYRRFQETMRTVMEPKTFEGFKESFSLENMARIAAENVQQFGGEYRRYIDGVPRWTSIRLIADPILSKHEFILCFRFVDDELRERAQSVELLESSLAAARESAKRKEIFFSNISHDMRTPLNAIIGLTRLLREHMDEPQEAERYLSLVEDAGEQLSGLVGDVLDISHSEHVASGVLHVETTDLAEVIERAVAPFRDRAQAENKQIDVSIETAHTVVKADARRLRQVLNNLISNALKYSYAGARVTIRLDAEERDESDTRRTRGYRIIVADTGIGMSEEFLPHLFEPYAREEVFAPRGITGTGLGMPIVKNLVEQMGGTIDVESTPDVGTTYYLNIPFETVENTSAPTDAGATTAASVNAACDDNRADTPITALVAEDNVANTIIVQSLLESLGATVVCVEDGQAALETFAESEEGAFDVILMDMQMPRMDGAEATRAIRALDRADAKTVGVVAVTASAFADDVAQAMRAGMDSFTTKPLSLDGLKHAIEEALRRRRKNNHV
ncbi:ATP-binding protein [Collinsella sp. An2]|uniref:hybrid sensor histidine kinase/response regulator n=1 Tax=Collinsella sp. An2 TaxID=1965585 RepID=UPI000B39ED11|nr:ATP-binding protein [Collinsella sp. An2]OUP08237.1 hypothetical protein B5F33_07435 [Collinsella sp. An2]